jgi:hypothetical protein
MTITDRLAAQDAPTIPVPPPEQVRIGVRAGVVWYCYREPGETPAQWERRAEMMRRALCLQF